MVEGKWLPEHWTQPINVPLVTGQHLRPIRVSDVDLVMTAVLGSRERLWSIFGRAWGWPSTSITVEEQAAGLARQEASAAKRASFGYGLFDAGEREILGGVSIHQPVKAGADAEVSWWVVDLLVGGAIDVALADFVPQWLREAWPFQRPRLIVGSGGWAEWQELPDLVTPAVPPLLSRA